MATHHRLRVDRTAHYYSLGTPGPQIQNLWLVCHGYGQLAGQFISVFESIRDEETLIVAPEGLSLFYWKFTGNDPAASWMTRRHRLDEISDYTDYLQKLLMQYLAQLSPNVRIHLLGFSQGTATIARWILQKQPPFHHFILWSGFLPEDMDYQPYRSYFADKHLHFRYGLEDPFLTPERLKMHQEILDRVPASIHQQTFEGKHVIPREELIRLKGELGSKE